MPSHLYSAIASHSCGMFDFPPRLPTYSWSCRYLTKIADQIIVLMSEEHASAIVWSDEEAGDTLEEIGDDDDDERLFTYSVAKTKEEQENVTPLPGFVVRTSEFLHTWLP